jgi:hypothetical protein
VVKSFPKYEICRKSIVAKVIEYDMKSLPLILRLFPFKTNGEAMNFFCSLIEYDRCEEFDKRICSSDGKQLIRLFNSLPKHKKIVCELLTGFFARTLYFDNAFKVVYLEKLIRNGLIIIDLPDVKYKMVEQSLDLLKLLSRQGLIQEKHLFPKESYESCLAGTGENIRWVIQFSWFRSDHMERMKPCMKNVDALMEYKKYYTSLRVSKLDNFDYVFDRLIESNENGDWTEMQKYFVYRDNDESIFRRFARITIPLIRRCSDRYSIVFKNLVLRYGPYRFSDQFLFTEYLTNDWLFLVYWLWRAGAKFPRNLVDKIYDYYLILLSSINMSVLRSIKKAFLDERDIFRIQCSEKKK